MPERGAVKILIVEDDETGRMLFESVLKESGYEVIAAVDGEEALSLIASERPSLVLIDINIPKVSGIEVLRRCRGDGLLGSAKVYALTGTVDRTVQEAGFDGVIQKPVRIAEFLKTVGGALQ